MTLPTRRQVAVLRAIADYLDTNGYPPTQRWLMQELSLGSTNATSCHLAALGKKGLLERDFGVARGLRVTPAGRASLAATKGKGR